MTLDNDSENASEVSEFLMRIKELGEKTYGTLVVVYIRNIGILTLKF